MEKQKTTVKGGYISRSTKTGRFVEVGSRNGVKKPTAQSVTIVKEASTRRSAALKRLVNR